MVTVLDWAIVAFTIALGIWGYRQGLIVGAMTLVGFGAGAFAGSRLGPMVLARGSESPYAPLCAALGALLAWLISRSVVEPLKRVAAITATVASGNLSQPIEFA